MNTQKTVIQLFSLPYEATVTIYTAAELSVV